jgi:membrane protein
VYAVDVLWRAAEDHGRQAGATAAAAMSYYALLSLFPLLVAVVAIVGWAIRDPALQAQVVDAIVDQLPSNANLRPQVEAVVGDVARTQNGLLGILGVLGSLWTASGIVGALRRALNRAFDVPGTRSFVHGKALDLLGVLGVLGLSLLSVAATAALGVLRAAADDRFRSAASNLAWALVYLLLPLALSYVTFLVVYRLVPNREVRGAPLWLGASLAAAGFELAKAGFGLYVVNFGRYAEVYGALGGVVAFLVFVFVVANIVIFAAELTAELLADRMSAVTGACARSDGPPAGAG